MKYTPTNELARIFNGLTNEYASRRVYAGEDGREYVRISGEYKRVTDCAPRGERVFRIYAPID